MAGWGLGALWGWLWVGVIDLKFAAAQPWVQLVAATLVAIAVMGICAWLGQVQHVCSSIQHRQVAQWLHSCHQHLDCGWLAISMFARSCNTAGQGLSLSAAITFCACQAKGLTAMLCGQQASALEKKRIEAWAGEVGHTLQTDDPRLWLIGIVMFWTVLACTPLLAWTANSYPLMYARRLAF